MLKLSQRHKPTKLALTASWAPHEHENNRQTIVITATGDYRCTDNVVSVCSYRCRRCMSL
jgi:hypothetical protein